MITYYALSVLTVVPDESSGPKFDSQSVVTWGVKAILPLILGVIGLGIIASARGGRISDNANTITNVIAGCGVIAGGAALYAFSDQLVTLAFGGGS